MREIRAYLANQLGFSETGRYVLDNLIIPRITRIGIAINNPFLECRKELDLRTLKALERGGKYGLVREFWRAFNQKVTPINNNLMQNSDCLLAILDGGHAVDDGVSSEIGYYTGIKRGPIFAVRTDFRCGENIGLPINPQIYGYIIGSGGKLVCEPELAFMDVDYPILETWFTTIQKWYDSFTQQ